MMVEILCSLLTGMPFGRDISRMYADPIEEKRYLGHFFAAMDIRRFVNLSDFKKRLQDLMDAVRKEPPKSPESPVLVPGDPEKQCHAVRMKEGIPVSGKAFDQYLELAREIDLNWPNN